MMIWCFCQSRKIQCATYVLFADITDDDADESEHVMIIDDDGFTGEKENCDENTMNRIFRGKLRRWAVDNQINRMALKQLLTILKEHFEKGEPFLPEDPRTLLHTPPSVTIVPMDGEDSEYWHHGLANCLNIMFPTLNKPMTISLNINIDGLPLYNSSKKEFWPILFNVAEIPHKPPMAIGIFSGNGKSSDLNSFLRMFVDELDDITRNGMWINSQKMTVQIRCFICDSPARAFVKGER